MLRGSRSLRKPKCELWKFFLLFYFLCIYFFHCSVFFFLIFLFYFIFLIIEVFYQLQVGLVQPNWVLYKWKLQDGRSNMSAMQGIRSGLPVARSLGIYSWIHEQCNRFLAFLVFSVGKCFLKCSENSQHLLQEKERDMKSSRGSVNFVLSYKFNECDFKSVSCPVVSNLREINFVKLFVHLRVKSSNKFISVPTLLWLLLNPSVVKAAVSVWCISKKCFPQVRRRSRRSFSCLL